MFGEAGSETGLKTVSVELAKKYIKCLIRIFSFAIYFLVELVKMYNKGIIRILLLLYIFSGHVLKGTPSYFPAEQKDLGRSMPCSACVRHKKRRLLMYALMFCSPDGQDQKVDSSMKSTDAFKLVSTKISLALWNWSVWLVGRGPNSVGG